MILLMKRIRESQRDEESKLQIDRIAAMVVKRFSSRQVSQQPLESYIATYCSATYCHSALSRGTTRYDVILYIYIFLYDVH